MSAAAFLGRNGGKAHLMTFQLTPIGPLNPLRQLLIPAVPH
jgi:hypothetical protein